ncbi:hypothetical protein B0H11DRAFT_1912066 [Mycena galericulata]|nr:hypothetical protein B0H11DRAFT_1912066 [Mycena galericulata]
MPDTGDNYFDAHRFIGRDLHEAVLVKTVHDLVSTSSILDTILQTYDDDQLFRIALHSDDHWNIVSTYLAKATVQPTHPASTINYAGPPAIASFPLQHLPVKVRARLLLFMDLRMLYDYSATCKAIHLNVNRHIGRFMKKTFARIGLSWPNLRFMLAHTDSLLSGYQIHRLLFPGFTARGNTDVDVLDMFVHDFAAGAVSRFFEITTGFKIDRVKKKPSYWISSTFTLVHELPHLFPIKIAVHVAEEDEYPQMAAFRQKLTCNFPFMTGYGIVVPYAAFNFGGDALINHQYLLIQMQTTGSLSRNETCFVAPFHEGVWGLEGNGRKIETGVVWSLGVLECDGLKITPGPFVEYLDLECRANTADTDWASASNKILRLQ